LKFEVAVSLAGYDPVGKRKENRHEESLPEAETSADEEK
jgi:hypothetical protein